MKAAMRSSLPSCLRHERALWAGPRLMRFARAAFGLTPSKSPDNGNPEAVANAVWSDLCARRASRHKATSTMIAIPATEIDNNRRFITYQYNVIVGRDNDLRRALASFSRNSCALWYLPPYGVPPWSTG